jgi:uncharacterized protein (TIGR02757 family)
VSLEPRALRALGRVLEQVRANCDVEARLERDPLGLVRAVGNPADQELAGLVAAALAFGNVTSLRASISNVLEHLGPEPGRVLDDADSARRKLAGTGHRMLRADDITRLLVGARAMQRAHASLGARFAWLLRSRGALRGALVDWTSELRELAGLRPDGRRRGPAHILPDPSKNSGCKRLLLYLRWMVRRDEVDLGLWHEVSPSVLLIPVDTHIHRLSLNLGLTGCASPSWKAAEEITATLRRLDPTDPVRFDFALCHLGMLRACPSQRDAKACAGCGIQSVCRHWKGRRMGAHLSSIGDSR